MSEPFSTIAHALAWATDQLRAASKTSRLDAELLLGHILGWSRARVLAESRASLSSAQQTAFRELIARRAALEPVAYLVGHKEFYGLDFLVDRHVLVPRPETELLVELTLEYARAKNQEPRTAEADLADDLGFSVLSSRFLVADIGTGSGCIAVALAVHLPRALVYATDISPQALRVARQNVERHAVAERVRLVEGDLVSELREPVDLLVSNPPYTILSEIDEGVRRYEPHLALDGGADGLAIYQQLLAAAPSKLRPGGAVLLEIGATQGAAVVELARSHVPAARVELHQDLAGLDRVVTIAFTDGYPE
jgi:release factor glutamine methyltransferase